MNPAGNIWGFQEQDQFSEEPDGLYFFGAAGTFGGTSNADRLNAREDQAIGAPVSLSGPLPGQQSSWPMPRARSTMNQQIAPKPSMNYAAIASRARTEADIAVEREEALKQEALISIEKDKQRKLFADRTSYQHSNTPVCSFYPLGSCKYGQSCRYLHVDAPSELSYGGDDGAEDGFGRASLADTEPSANGPAFSRVRGLSAQPHLKDDSIPTQGGTEAAAAVGAANDEANECCICMGSQPVNNLYGILSHCNCVFCLNCIREWRTDGIAKHNQSMSSSTLRQCPLCRVTSYFVVPSTRTFTLKSLVGTTADAADVELSVREAQELLQQEKQAFIDAYKQSLQKKPCRNFLKNRSCPFGSSCFYLHIDENGEVEDKVSSDLDVSTKPRYLLNSSGETVVLNGTRQDLTFG